MNRCFSIIKNKLMHIAFLGPKGSYSHIAATKYAKYYCHHIKEYSCKNFFDIINLVENNHAEYGILPIENSNSGIIDEVCDLLINTQLVLIADIIIPIQHYVLATQNASLKKIQIIYSHPQPVQQCSKFLNNFSKWKIIFCDSSAIAIKTVAYLNQSNLAALGSIQGGIFYGLQPLPIRQKIISNYYINKTRFVILKNTNFLIINTTISEKIMLLIHIDQKLEKLYLILKILHFYNIKINFLKIYKLFHDTTKNMILTEIKAYLYHSYTQAALISIQKIPCTLKILGCYSSLPNSIK